MEIDVEGDPEEEGPNPWIAVLLTLLLPIFLGFGHIYAGRPGRGGAVFIMMFILMMAAIPAFILGSIIFGTFDNGITVYFCLYGFGVLAAARDAYLRAVEPAPDLPPLQLIRGERFGAGAAALGLLDDGIAPVRVEVMKYPR